MACITVGNSPGSLCAGARLYWMGHLDSLPSSSRDKPALVSTGAAIQLHSGRVLQALAESRLAAHKPQESSLGFSPAKARR